MEISYPKDKTIIDYLVKLNNLISVSPDIKDVFIACLLGFKSYNHINSPDRLTQLFEDFSLFNQLNDQSIINDKMKTELAIKIICDPDFGLQNSLLNILSEEPFEESKDGSEVAHSYLNLVKTGLANAQRLVLKYTLENEGEPLQVIDCIFWGALINRYDIQRVKASFDKISAIREFQKGGLIKFNQKMRFFCYLYYDFDIELNEALEDMMDDPATEIITLESMVIPDHVLLKMEEDKIRQEEERELEKKRLAKEEEDSKNVDCSICYDSLYSKQEQIFVLQSCDHIFHRGCLVKYLENEIKENKTPIKCPEVECGMVVAPVDLHELLPQNVHEKYEKFIFEKYVQAHPDEMSWCPTAGCPFIFEIDPNMSRFTCLMCEHKYCLKCRSDDHEGKCLNNDEKLLNAMSKLQCKKCPKCKAWVEKNQGCDHMTCKCGNQFCYGCGGEYPCKGCKGVENKICPGCKNKQYYCICNVEEKKEESIIDIMKKKLDSLIFKKEEPKAEPKLEVKLEPIQRPKPKFLEPLEKPSIKSEEKIPLAKDSRPITFFKIFNSQEQKKSSDNPKPTAKFFDFSEENN